MRKNGLKHLAAAGLSTLVLALSGCSTTQTTNDGYNDASGETESVEMGHTTSPASTSSGADRPRSRRYGYNPAVQGDMFVMGLPFPTGDEDTSAILLHQVMPRQVRAGDEFSYEYHVTNLTDGTLQNVAVFLESQDNLEIEGSSPRAQSSQDGSVWALGDLGPRETRIISVRATAEDPGRAANCVSVSYNNALCVAIDVINPSLTIDKAATPLALRCDTVEFRYRVCNTGTGAAQNVVIRDTLPEGMTTANGTRRVELPVGTIAEGDCVDRSVLVRVDGVGEFASVATATADGDITAESSDPTTRIVEPELAVTCETSRESQFMGRSVTYTFEVTNDGDGPSRNTLVSVNYPATARFLGASAGGTGGAGSTTWNLGTLEAGASRTVSVDLTSTSRGAVSASASVSGDCAQPASSRCEVAFEGIPAILLEVTDDPDPIEIGTQTTYTIRVTNQGSATGTGIRVSAQLPDSQEYVSSTGPTTGRAEGQSVSFAPLAALEPGQSQTYFVTIRATAEEDVRFAVEMTSDQFPRPVRETEATNQYE